MACLAAPIEAGIDHRAERCERRTVAMIEGQVAERIAQGVSKKLVGPLEWAPDGPGIGIKQ